MATAAASALAHVAAFAALAAQQPAPHIAGAPVVDVVLVRAAPEPLRGPAPSSPKPPSAVTPPPPARSVPAAVKDAPGPGEADTGTPSHALAQAPAAPAPTPAPAILASKAAATSSAPDPAVAWRREVWARIAAHAPRSQAGAGGARVAFRLDAAGGLVAVRLVRSSGRPAFDRACLAAVRAASPFPAPPAGLDASGLDFEVPIRPTGGA